MHTCGFIQINEQFSGSPLNEAQVFSVEISNAAGSRFVNSTTIFMQLLNSFTKKPILCNSFPFPRKLKQLSLII